MSSHTFKPKRIKLEIIKPNDPNAADQSVKYIPINIKSTGQQLQGKLYNMIVTQPPAPPLTEKTASSYSQFEEDDPKMYHSQSVVPKNEKIREQEAPQVGSVPCSLPTESDEVVSLSDDTSECSTEADPEELERLQHEFIEEASVLNEEVIDDLNEFFEHQPISDESHERIVKEILEERIDSFTKDCIQHQMKLVDAEVQTDTPLLTRTEMTNTSVSPIEQPQPPPPPPLPPKCKTSEASTQTLPEKSPKTSADVNTEVLNYLKRMEKRLISIEQRITRIEETRDYETDSESEEDEEEKDLLTSLKFPCKKRSQLELLEGILKVPRLKTNLDQKFRQIMGISETDTIDMILSELIDSSLQLDFRWRHTNEQQCFDKFTNINKLIYDCVKHHYRMFTNLEYTRLMTLILNRPIRQIANKEKKDTPKKPPTPPSAKSK